MAAKITQRPTAKDRANRVLFPSENDSNSNNKRKGNRDRQRWLSRFNCISQCKHIPFYSSRWASSHPVGFRYLWMSLATFLILLLCSNVVSEYWMTPAPALPTTVIEYDYYPRTYNFFSYDRYYHHVRRVELLRANSRSYRKSSVIPIVTKYCKEQHDWQLRAFPTCNTVHEMDMHHFNTESDRIRKLGNGHHRDVWEISALQNGSGGGTDKVVLKTLRYMHKFDVNNYDRHRRDALAMDRLTFSPYVVNIYSFCSNSGLVEHGGWGDLEKVIWPLGKKSHATLNLSRRDKITMALQVAMGIADTHDADHNGYASIAHTDIAPKQFIYIDGVYKLNDFNRCRLLGWHTQKNTPCGYRVGKNTGKFRSPEEYRYDEQTEMVDVYSMGNIFYGLLTGKTPFYTHSEKTALALIMKGTRPPIPDKIRDSTHQEDVALLTAMKMSHIHDPKKRTSAREVADYLEQQVEQIEERDGAFHHDNIPKQHFLGPPPVVLKT